VRLEGLGQLKNQMTSSGIQPTTFRACGIVPQPTTLPRASVRYELNFYIMFRGNCVFKVLSTTNMNANIRLHDVQTSALDGGE
jgi:hypothetical protein